MSRVIIDKPALARYLGWEGPVGHDMSRRLRTLEFRAKQSVGVDSHSLQRGIETRKRTVVDGLQGEVGNWHHRYAAAHHEGARPHVIVPRPENVLGRLVFTVNGRKVFATRVQHPGNRPNPYLSRWLREAVR